MSEKISYHLTGDSVFLYYKGRPRLFASDTPEFKRIEEILQVLDQNKVEGEELLSEFWKTLLEKPVDKNVNADFEVSEANGEVVNGKVLPKVLGQRLLQHREKGLPYQPILNFWERLKNNPSYLAVQRLFECLEVNHHPILEDGRFIAWRKVRRLSDGRLVDIRTQSVDNSVGAKPRMDRNEVEDNPDITCGKGYHGASWSYARHHYGNENDVMLEVAVCPSDVVSVPKDYNSQKMRICGYEVLSEVEVENTNLLADHKPKHGFAVNPDDDYTCDDCLNHLDYCTCEDFDEDDDLVDYCEDCGDPDCFGDCDDEDEEL